MKEWFIRNIKKEIKFQYAIAPTGNIIITGTLFKKKITGAVFNISTYTLVKYD